MTTRQFPIQEIIYPPASTIIGGTVEISDAASDVLAKAKAIITAKDNPTATATDVAEYIPQSNTLTPIINPSNGFPVASGPLVDAFANDPVLKLSIENSVIDATSEALGNGNPLTNKEIDLAIGTSLDTVIATADLIPPQGGSPNAPGNPVPILVQPFQPTQNEASSGSGLRYPEEKGDAEDSVMFEAFTYEAKNSDNLGSPQGMCILSIQPSISDSNTVGWGDGRINALQFQVYKTAKNAIQDGYQKAATDASGKLAELLGPNSEFTKNKYFDIFAASQAAQTNDVFTRETGAILNPNLELLFQGPELRTFNFNFQLSARGQKEADNIKKIIRFFKKNMAVNKGDTDIFLKSPNIFKISYTQSDSLNKFKPCALRAFNVDYTPLGTYMTFEDGTMVSYQLSMQFQELFPIIADDDYSSQTAVGY